MNPLTDLLFTLSWFILLVWALRTMARGWNLMTIDPKEIKYTESSKQITRPPHPELADVKPGDELLVVNFGEEEKQDPLYKSMQDRIETLREEEGTTDVEEDDDDDGGAPVPALR